MLTTAPAIMGPTGSTVSRQVLEPLTDRQLAACVQKARSDRYWHVCAKHSPRSFQRPWHDVHIMGKLAEMRRMTQHELFIRHELLMWFVSKEVTEDWCPHVTEGDQLQHQGSVEHYLRSLVQRVQSGRST